MAKKEAEVHGIRIKETRADRTFNVLNLIFWMIVLFITLYPLWLVLIASVSDPDAVLAGEVLFWPKGFSLMGYEAVFQHSELWQSYLNSIIYTVLGSALSVIVSLAAAYALSRKFAGKAFVNFLITFTMFFSGGLIPIFLNVRDLGLYDTRLVMILMNTVSVWNLMVARTYIQSSIPNELYEAAVMDGAEEALRFLDSETGRAILSGCRVLREKPFEIRMDEDGQMRLVQGVIDLMVLTESGAVLVDYKTDHTGLSEGEVRAKHGLQVNLYRQAAERAGIAVERCEVYLFFTGKSVEIRPGDGERKEKA